MKSKTLIVGSVLVAVALGGYLFLKKKNTVAGETTGGNTSTSGTPATNTDSKPTYTGMNPDIFVQNPELLKYNQALDIQKKWLAEYDKYLQANPNPNNYIDRDLKNYIQGKIYAGKINSEINSLGYKLKVKEAPSSEIIKITL